jgi:hypothetical protein
MFSQVFSKKQKIHKQQDQLYRVLIFCLLLFSPVILLLSPLPSFLIYQGTENYVSHLVGWLIITVVSLLEGYLFLSVWQNKELIFFKYLFGRNFNKNLLLTFFKFTILLHVCIWAGYAKVDWSFSNLALTASIYAYSAGIFILQLKFKLAPKTEIKMRLPNIKIVNFILLKGNLTSIALFLIGSYVCYIFLNNLEKIEVILAVVGLWLILTTYLMLQIWRSIKKNQTSLSLFLKNISLNYCALICTITNWLFIFALVTTLTIMFILVLPKIYILLFL